ncbi:ABC transporter related [Ignisphaera aggregans DSM 17230]|uniref:ABC transporter related n=1 Tax=Ignisphaera aggregans (strain DSM 17230 / JCM 13409 / AQ1.S1) TaxID=583356 RepID=E0STD9_IGNAA|nr:ABC transporter related [Ignisphaera aggregans DSM 17230]
MSNIVAIVRNLWKYYIIGNTSVAVLKNVNLEVRRGEIIGIHGPSGSGKSTLLKIMAGLEKPDQGEVIIEGYNLNLLSEDGLAMIRTNIVSYIPQDYGLIEDFTVYENIELPLMLLGLEKRERHIRIMELIDYMGLRGKESIRVKYLSGGEKQRVAIARALTITPSLLLADEPASNLDWENAKKVLELFVKISRDFNTSIVIVSHDPRTLEYTYRRFEMFDGILRPLT